MLQAGVLILQQFSVRPTVLTRAHQTDLFPKLKKPPLEKHFQTNEKAFDVVIQVIREIKKDGVLQEYRTCQMAGPLLLGTRAEVTLKACKITF